MSDTTTRVDQPTAWFLAGDDTASTSAARWYWPPSITTEVWDPETGDWVDTPDLWETLQEDDSWVKVTEAEAEQWIAATSGSTAPSSPAQSAAG